MGELHANMHATLDGVIQANGGPTEQDRGFEFPGWEWPFADPESDEQVVADIESSDALLLGHTTYDIFRGFWPAQTDPVGRAFNRVPKYVASRGNPELSWETSTQLTDAAAQVRELRERHEQIHTWGSANLLQTLFGAGLVDQLNLWVYPVVLGQGKKLFPDGAAPTRFARAEPPKAFPAGVVLLRLRRLDGLPETGSPTGYR
ncbi:dihydrofolate reductase family protein [Nocardia halotolerans]|uniref:Dihydrofolate reductase family protein n=1 Tax=Nocardia halotolerans TaxID=1755878 RepID=A0ABV8VHG9_9NOCA